ncbi:unnamed protein product [Bathycoccus prasinos]
MPSFLTTTTRAASAVNNNNTKEKNNNASTKKSRQKSLKPSSSESSRKANQKQQISVPSSTPLPGKEIIRKSIGTTLSLTLAVGIGYFLGNNPTYLSEIFGKTFGGGRSASASSEEMVVLNEGKNETYEELFSIDTMDSATKANMWRVVNDGVMGGVSNSAMMPPSPNSPGFSRFAGTVRLENNGGFAFG